MIGNYFWLAVFHEVAGDGVEPCRKLLSGIEARPALIELHERVLGEIRGVVLVLQAADQVMEQLLGITINGTAVRLH